MTHPQMKTCKHDRIRALLSQVEFPPDFLFGKCPDCDQAFQMGELPEPKCPSDHIRERAEEIRREKDTMWNFRRSNESFMPDLWARVDAIEEYLDQLAGFPKSE